MGVLKMADKKRKFESSTLTPHDLKPRLKPAEKSEGQDSTALEAERFPKHLIHRLIDRLKDS